MANPRIPRRESPLGPAGEGRSAWRRALEAGAAVLHDMTPLKDFDIYVAGLHCARDDAAMQMEAHHYCRQVNQDLIQCVLFDGNTKDACPRSPSARSSPSSSTATARRGTPGTRAGDGEPGDAIPLGEPRVMWSFNRDGEAEEALRQDFQAAMGHDEAARRAQRQGLLARAHPQRGVDAMAGEFAGTTPIPGVVDRDAD